MYVLYYTYILYITTYGGYKKSCTPLEYVNQDQLLGW